MSSNPQQVSLMIMGKEYRIACDAQEQDDLIVSAQKLDIQMRKMRDSGKITGSDRIAVMAALGIAADFLASRNSTGPFAALSLSEVREKITSMNALLDSALAPQEKLF